MAPTRFLIFVCVTLGGFAGLGWELIWQVKTSLAIGISSQATALVISATMGGMAIGTALAGTFLQRHASKVSPFALYGLLELVVGLSGFFVESELAFVAKIDQQVFQASGADTSLLHLALIVLTLGPPAMAMGASIPVLGLIGKQSKSSIGILYGVNTLGAAVGTIIMAFAILPFTGVALACTLLALVNFSITSVMLGLAFTSKRLEVEPAVAQQPERTHPPAYLAVAFISGFSIFALEVVFFRAMRAAYLSTTYSFAVMLSSVLLSLAVGAYGARLLKSNKEALGSVLAVGGTLVLIVTPLVERLDAFTSFYAINPHLSKFFLSLSIIGPVVMTLGLLFPLLLDESGSPFEWGLLHASNTVGAIAGALFTAWVLLPTFGLAPASWVVAILLLVAGVLAGGTPKLRTRAAVAGLACFLVAFVGQSGIGKTRVVGERGKLRESQGFRVLAYRETPDFTISVVEEKLSRSLYIDGFNASAHFGEHSYMTWMGRLPMMIHPNPKDALVICFGRGETANALRREGPESLDIVDISKAVFEMAPYFEANQGVLQDDRVHPIVMDGRSWLRRTQKTYDVITLEPMPPTFAGVNNLYSREFYELAKARLRPGGTIAQWVPYHLITPDQAEAISRTFIDVFPDAILWIYPPYRTGILVGKKGTVESQLSWYGLDREASGRELTQDQILGSVRLDAAGLARYADHAVTITDDNQYLAYGVESQRHDFGPVLGLQYEKESLERIDQASSGGSH